MKKIILTILFFVIPLTLQASITLNQLTLDQKIGQLFMVAAVADEDIAKDYIRKKPYRVDREYVTYLINHFHVGGIIYLGSVEFLA